MLRTVDLFSGIGGFSLGLGMAGGFETIAFCEQDKFCQQVLRKHWPDVPIHNDIRTIPTDGLGRVDIIAGGWPCQPWSQAGQQRGAADDRDLWPEMARLVAELRPKYLIGENVRGFVNEPMGLQRSLSDLESIGYSAVPFIIPACAVDAPHRRDRVWIIAHTNSDSESDGTINAGPRSRELVANPRSPDQERQTIGGTQSGGCSPQRDVADTDGRRCTGRREHEEQPYQAASTSEDVADAVEPRREGRIPRGADTKREDQSGHTGCGGAAYGQSAENWWAVEPDVGRVAHGVHQRVDRLKALGNAVVPQVVAQIGKAILSAEEWENSNETKGPELKGVK